MYSDWCDAQGNGVWAGHAASGVLTNWIERVSEAGFAPVLHAIGDAAVGLALHELEGVDSNLVPRVEHAQCIAQQDLGLLHGRMFAVQPLHQPDDMKIAIQSLGENRIDELHNWRRMLEAGGILSFGSDWPIATPDPISAMAIAIGCGLTPSEALIASTTHAALSLRSEKAGNLGIGSYGDVVVLDQDPLKCDWKVDQPSVTMTILDGRIVYRRS
jgi:hypothetical protein